MKCKNCNQPLESKDNYCSNCGQKNIDKLNVKFLLSNFLDNYLNFDSKVFRTLKYLILKPGVLSKEYLDGKRVSFAPPVRLYIVLSVLFFFLISIIDAPQSNSDDSISTIEDSVPSVDSTAFISDTIAILGDNIDTSTAQNTGITFNLNEDGGVEGVQLALPTYELREMEYKGTLDHYLDSTTAEMTSFEAYVTRKMTYAKIKGEGFLDILINQISLFLLIFIPLLALLYATCFSRNKYGYIGHLVFNLHFNSFVMFFLCIDQVLLLIIPPDSTIESVWGWLMLVTFPVYLIIAIMNFYDRKWWNALYKFFLLLFGYLTLSIVFLIMVFVSSFVLT